MTAEVGLQREHSRHQQGIAFWDVARSRKASMELSLLLLDVTCGPRKNGAGVGADQPDRGNHDHENDGGHHRMVVTDYDRRPAARARLLKPPLPGSAPHSRPTTRLERPGFRLQGRIKRRRWHKLLRPCEAGALFLTHCYLLTTSSERERDSWRQEHNVCRLPAPGSIPEKGFATAMSRIP